jgi:hypothetical protein
MSSSVFGPALPLLSLSLYILVRVWANAVIASTKETKNSVALSPQANYTD